MFLYEKDGKKIHVYSLSRFEKDIEEYRKEQIKKIPFKKRCWYTEEEFSNFQGTPILFEKDLDKDQVTKEELVGKNKSLNLNKDLDYCMDLLNHFYSDKYIDRLVARVEFLKKMRYLLIASKCFSSRKENGKVIMKVDDIIEIPKSLYLLQLLEQEKFSMLAGQDISQQLELFDFYYVDTITLEELKRIHACGMTKKTSSEIISKAENDAHILKLIKNKR